MYFQRVLFCLLCTVTQINHAQAAPLVVTESPKISDALGPSIKTNLESLPVGARRMAEAQRARMGFFDENHTFLTPDGRYHIAEAAYNDTLGSAAALEINGTNNTSEIVSDTVVTVYTPEGVPLLHSLPGSQNVIYLNFLGGVISGRAWNQFYGLPPLQTQPYNVDGLPGFSASERVAMANIWRRVAEDYSPWQIDVTTEPPAVRTSTTVETLITTNVDANGVAMPSSSAGGVAFMDVFGFYDAPFYSPALVYYNNLNNGRSDIVAEAVSHETGHLFGLSHDGTKAGASYYTGAGVGATSWGPIMGAPYNRAVSKFNLGDYADANNQEDDIAIISAAVPLRSDDVGNTPETALQITSSPHAGSYMITASNDVDMFKVVHAGGLLTISATPFVAPDTGLGGNNVDLALQLLDGDQSVIATSDSATSSAALITVTISAGVYYARVYAVGNWVTPYTAYGSVGQYNLGISFEVTAPTTTRPTTPTTRPTTKPSVCPVIYSANMKVYPSGWTVNVAGTWGYGKPSGTYDPKDSNVIGNVISGTGLYPKPLAGVHLINSPLFSLANTNTGTLTFDRFLGILEGDTATIEVCVAGVCTQLWRNVCTVSDLTWTRVSYVLPASVQRQSAVRIRFGLGPTIGTSNTMSSFGWNIRNLTVTAC